MRQGLAALLAAPLATAAHDGHGATQAAHWHATDVWGFAIAALAVATVWWLGRGK